MKWTWKCLAALLLVCVMVAVLPGLNGAAQAAPAESAGLAAAPGQEGAAPAALGDSGTLTVTPGSSAELSDLRGANVVVDLYRVASAGAAKGGSLTYTLEERYSGLDLSGVLDRTDETALAALSQQAARLALGDAEDRDTPTIQGRPASSAITGIAPGLYLVVVRGDRPEEYLGTMPDENGEQIVTRVQTENWIYTYWPQLVFVPNGGSYDVKMTLKPTRGNGRLGSLEIVKNLTNYVAGQPGFFVFRVDVYLHGALYESRIEELHFTEAGQGSVVISGLPEGAEVVVTEEYSGASYRLTSDRTVHGTITMGEVTRVEFTNTGSTGEGGAITNHFSYDHESGWVWTPIPAVE